jgi:hypothetical protein
MIFPANGFEYYGQRHPPHASIPGNPEIPGPGRTTGSSRIFGKITVARPAYARFTGRGTMNVFPVFSSEKNDTSEKYTINH